MTETEIHFVVDAAEPAVGIEASGRMIADSENRAFVYLLDSGTKFIYLQFSEAVWPSLAEALERETVPLLMYGQQILPLVRFHEELWMLLENIKDNTNYSETFRLAVETVFDEALASRM
ncbi:hypothetical protein [Planococcus sp. YIM B11945]|uniref:UPF0738 family protein n=1 Tax=Planococcus sp. YIM B11945 TaxID=3435410 RepID=UPI003D7E5227